MIARLSGILVALVLLLSLSVAAAIPAQAASEVWVDDVTDPSEDGTLAHPYDSIQEGIDHVDAGGTVHVLAGTYHENITLKDGVQVLGAGAVVTIINGGASGSVVTAIGAGSATELNGFTLMNGSAGPGGGMFNDSSSPKVTNCIFSGNAASSTGGGMYNTNGSSPTLTNCIFTQNTAHVAGGGIFNDSSVASLINCTFYANSAHFAGGIFNGYSNTTAANCIFRDIDSEFDEIVGGITVTYSDIPGGHEGTGNIGTDPEFINAGAGDFRLHSTSPCIDKGKNSAVPSWLLTDIEGKPRVMDGDNNGVAVVDMGAYEFPFPKYVQEPDTTTSGVDVLCDLYSGIMLLDDFQCTSSGPLTNFTIWGSWLDDTVDQNASFILQIYPNLPADDPGNTDGYAEPDMRNVPLWSHTFGGGGVPGYDHAVVYATGNEKFWDPASTFPTGTDTQVWQYDFSVTPEHAFTQQAGTIYWLSVDAVSSTYPGVGEFGWKTSGDQRNSKAFYFNDLNQLHPLSYPAGHTLAGSSMDLAFSLHNYLNTVEISVEGKGENISDGDSTPSISDDTYFGIEDIAGGGVVHTFTIRNSGPGELVLSGSPDKVVIGGANSADFTVIKQPVSPVFPGSSNTFEIQFLPVKTGLRTATVTIANNDTDENPYEFAIQGTGIPPGSKGVGGDVYPVNKIRILLPWLALAAAVSLGAALLIRWRVRSSHKV